MHIIKDKNVTAGTNCKEYRFYEQKVTESVRKEKNELRQKQHPSHENGRHVVQLQLENGQYTSPGYTKLYLMLHGADEE